MSRPKNENTYTLTQDKRTEAIKFIRTYPLLQEEERIIIEGSAASDGQPRSSDPGDPTAQKAEKLVEVRDKLRCIEKAYRQIPDEEIARDILQNIIKRIPYTSDHNPKTFAKWRRRFIWNVATNLDLLKIKK